VQLRHDIGDRLAYSGKPAQLVLGGDAVEWLDQRRKRVRGAQVGFGAEAIVAGDMVALIARLYDGL